MPSIVKFNLNNSEFNKLSKDKFEFFNDNKKFTKGYKIIAFKHNKVLGCYLQEDEELYLGAREDEILEKLENELKFDFDWL